MTNQRYAAEENRKVTTEMERAWSDFEPVIPNTPPSLMRDSVLLRQGFMNGFLACSEGRTVMTEPLNLTAIMQKHGITSITRWDASGLPPEGGNLDRFNVHLIGGYVGSGLNVGDALQQALDSRDAAMAKEAV